MKSSVLNKFTEDRPMIVQIALVAILMFAVSPVGQAQGHIEIIPFFGYTASEGIEVNPQLVNGAIVNRLTPKNDYSFGFEVDYQDDDAGWGVGFLFNKQSTELEVGLEGGPPQAVTGMDLRNYHGIFTYNDGEEGDVVRAFFLAGLGATRYSFDPIQGNSVNGESKFSSTWGGGMKIYVSEHFGFRLSGRWTPTYINSDADGIYCSPYWAGGCWVVGDANYSQQFEMSVGTIFRF